MYKQISCKLSNARKSSLRFVSEVLLPQNFLCEAYEGSSLVRLQSSFSSLSASCKIPAGTLITSKLTLPSSCGFDQPLKSIYVHYSVSHLRDRFTDSRLLESLEDYLSTAQVILGMQDHHQASSPPSNIMACLRKAS